MALDDAVHAPAAGDAGLHFQNRLARHALRRLPAGWRLLHHSAGLEEVRVATLGPIDLRRTGPTLVARAQVKGDAATALRIGLQRLADYVGGDNMAERVVATAGPAVLRPAAPGCWQVQVALPELYPPFAVPVPRSGRVRIGLRPGETVATMALSGRLLPAKLARAEATILMAIAASPWRCADGVQGAAGMAMLRLAQWPVWLPWPARFEVAIPVTEE